MLNTGIVLFYFCFSSMLKGRKKEEERKEKGTKEEQERKERGTRKEPDIGKKEPILQRGLVIEGAS